MTRVKTIDGFTVGDKVLVNGNPDVIEHLFADHSVTCKNHRSCMTSDLKLIIEELRYPPVGWNVGDLVDEDDWRVISPDTAVELGGSRTDVDHQVSLGKLLIQQVGQPGFWMGSTADKACNPVTTPVKPEPVLGGWVTQADDPNVEVARFEGDSGWRA